MSSSSSDSMSSMSMVFTTGHSTPLFSAAWTPNSTGTYAGTCIFLAVLAIIARCLQAWRHGLETRWHDKAVARRYVVVADKERESDRSSSDTNDASDKSDDAVLTVRGVDEKVRVVRRHTRQKEAIAWRLSVDLPRACVFTVQAGVGYLL